VVFIADGFLYRVVLTAKTSLYRTLKVEHVW